MREGSLREHVTDACPPASRIWIFAVSGNNSTTITLFPCPMRSSLPPLRDPHQNARSPSTRPFSPTPSCGRERDKREGQYVRVAKHRCSTQTLARVSRPRLSSPSHHPDEADDRGGRSPTGPTIRARASRGVWGLSNPSCAEPQRDQPLVIEQI